jgi:hypothetical protein
MIEASVSSPFSELTMTRKTYSSVLTEGWTITRPPGVQLAGVVIRSGAVRSNQYLNQMQKNYQRTSITELKGINDSDNLVELSSS